MASWCWICRRKVDSTYRYYKGDKAHRKCIASHKTKEAATKKQKSPKELKDAM